MTEGSNGLAKLVNFREEASASIADYILSWPEPSRASIPTAQRRVGGCTTARVLRSSQKCRTRTLQFHASKLQMRRLLSIRPSCKSRRTPASWLWRSSSNTLSGTVGRTSNTPRNADDLTTVFSRTWFHRQARSRAQCRCPACLQIKMSTGAGLSPAFGGYSGGDLPAA